MFKKGKNFMKLNAKGFTFIEVMVVIVIVAILAASWFFTGKGHLRIAMATEAKVLIDRVIAQERNYMTRHSTFFVTDTVEYSRELNVDARQNKYFKRFKTAGGKVTGSGVILDGIKVVVYPSDEDLSDFIFIGEYWLDGTKTIYEFVPKNKENEYLGKGHSGGSGNGNGNGNGHGNGKG